MKIINNNTKQRKEYTRTKPYIGLSKVYQENDYGVIEIDSPKFGLHKFLIDAEDIKRCSEINWSVFQNQYNDEVYYYCSCCKTKAHPALMLHRFIMDAPKGMLVDHVDHNTHDTRKSNLRLTARLQNNRKRHANNTSGETGVIWWHYKNYNKWMANIKLEDKRIILGYFDKYEDAVKARRDAELKYFGEYNNVENRD